VSPRTLATATVCLAPLVVLVVYAPALQAPFLAPKFAALEVIGGLGLVAWLWQRTRADGPRWTGTATLGAWLVSGTSLLAWAAAASRPVGSPYAVDAMFRWVSLLGLACAASVVADVPAARARMFEAATAAAATVAAVGLLQHVERLPLAIPVISMPGSTFGNRNFAAEAMAMGLPLGLAAALGARRGGSRSAAAALWTSLAVELAFLGATRTRGAWVAAACGVGTTLGIGRPRLRVVTLSLAAGAVGLTILAASLPARPNPRDAGDAKRYATLVEVLAEGLDAQSPALRSRVGLWRRTTAMVKDHPVLGVGPGNWPVVFPRYAEPGATSDGVLSVRRAPRQAHDDALERAAETGLPGLLAALCFAASLVGATRRRLRTGDADSRMATAAAAGSLVALAVLSVASFPLDMPGSLCLGGLCVGLVATDSAPTAGAPAPMRLRVLASMLAGAVLLEGWAVVRAERSIRSSFWLGAAERAMRADRGASGAATALADLGRALAADPDDYRAHLRSAQMLLRQQRALDSCLSARRALAIEPDAPNAWGALALAELSSGDDPAARRDATHALTLLADFPLALYVRAQAADHAGDTATAARDRQRLRALADASPEDDSLRSLLASPDGS
jgi:O-antigen ligase